MTGLEQATIYPAWKSLPCRTVSIQEQQGGRYIPSL